MKSKLILLAILVLGFVLRLYKIDTPLADHHSWRQADTAAVARNFIKTGFDFFKPQIDNFIPLHPGVPNKERLFLVEPPIYNSLVAGVYSILGVDIKWARMVSILFSLGSAFLLYLISKRFFGEKVGLLSAFFFSVLPYNIFYSRAVLPEPMIIFLTLSMFYFCLKWLEDDSTVSYLLFAVSSALSFTQKSFPLFFLLPIFCLVFQKYKFLFLKQKKLYLWLLLVFLPFLLWRWWIGHYPQGIPGNLWLFNQNNIRFKGAFFYWIFAERVGKLILGYWGLPLLVLGMVLKPKKEGLFFHAWFLSLLIFTCVFAAGNVTHDYYQIPLVPIFCIFMAKGANLLLFDIPEKFSKVLSYLLFAVCCSLFAAFGWYEVRGFYNIQSGVDLAGEAVDKLMPQNALVITGDSNDATLLYNTNRWGWSAGYASPYPNTPETVKYLKGQGASVYVATKFDRNSEFGKYMLKNFQLIDETNQYVIFKLEIKSL